MNDVRLTSFFLRDDLSQHWIGLYFRCFKFLKMFELKKINDYNVFEMSFQRSSDI